MSENDNINENILSLYNAQKWREIAALSCTANGLRTCRLSWVLPDISDLRWISDIVRDCNLSGIASVGCGCGLLEWLLQKCSGKSLPMSTGQILVRRAFSYKKKIFEGLDIIGIELDSSWWNSKYSPPQLLKNIIFVEDKSTNFRVPKKYALLFCYFNNSAAFCDYVENYKGHLILVIGPVTGNCTTDPLPFDKKFEEYNWKLIKERKLVYSDNYITAYGK